MNRGTKHSIITERTAAFNPTFPHASEREGKLDLLRSHMPTLFLHVHISSKVYDVIVDIYFSKPLIH